MDETERLELLRSLEEARGCVSDAAFKLRREFSHRSRVAKTAAKVERAIFDLKRQLTQLDIGEARVLDHLPGVTRGGRPVDMDQLKTRD